ncbi:S1 RNA-binding domain-containing protein [Candidatus Nomurabacteria bacterium]|nr:S1 RNA-binding domain-containing protein [Candidatus Nomurabacteria bacterium]
MNTILDTKVLDIEVPVIEEDSIVEGPVIAIEKGKVFIDLPPFGTGIIFGREFLAAREIISKLNIGDMISVKVIDRENNDGYIELSLKEAKQALIWGEAEDAIKNKTVFNLEIKEANKGGLIVSWQGMDGFLPSSQLRPENYPRVEEGDKDKILEELNKLVGTNMDLVIISALPKEGKLIFSEKESNPEERREMISEFNVGDVVECEVTGLVEFGIFLKLKEGVEGLVHISELDWGLVENTKELFKIGDKVKAKIIEIKDGKISLSVKALKENPWKEFEGKLKKGDIIDGAVIKFNRHGALISLKPGVAGLVHNSTFGGEEKLRSSLQLGKSYPFQITLFEPQEQKMTLAYLDPNKKEEAKEE